MKAFAWAVLLGTVPFFGNRVIAGDGTDEPSADAVAAATRAVDEARAALESHPDSAEARAALRDAQATLVAEQAWAARQAVGEHEAAHAAADKDATAAKTKLAALKDQESAAVAKRDKAAADAASTRKNVDELTGKADAARAAGDADVDKRIDEAKKAAAHSAESLAKAEAAVAAVLAEKESASATLAAAERSRSDAVTRLAAARDRAATAHAEALGGLRPITSEQWDYAKARHLLFRAGFGGTPEDVKKLVELGPHKAVEFLVEYRARPVANLEFNVLDWERPLDYENRLHADARNRMAEQDERRDATQHAALVDWWVKRMVESPRPLEEKLVLFWHDHFASSYLTLRNAQLLHQQNQMFRAYADNFDALLHGIVIDPAMIQYLNNEENVAGNHNENLGREVLELFSIGEENSAAHRPDGYTETDVRDANTRALTGATFERYSGQFRFFASRHDGGVKTLLGKAGAWGPHEAVDVILEHPAVADYLARKLWRYFVRWDIDPESADRVAHVLRANGYRLRPALGNLFLSEAFYDPASMGAHIKSPVELMVGTARTIKIAKPEYPQWRHALSNTGQALFDPPSVAGWPEGRHWINANLLMLRYTAVAELIKKSETDFVAEFKKTPLRNADEVVDHLTRRFLLVELSEEKRKSLVECLGPLPPTSEWDSKAKEIQAKLLEAIMLIVSCPEYQVS